MLARYGSVVDPDVAADPAPDRERARRRKLECQRPVVPVREQAALWLAIGQDAGSSGCVFRLFYGHGSSRFSMLELCKIGTTWPTLGTTRAAIPLENPAKSRARLLP
ncbi:hypothetical protein D3C83_20090 [compost metagenome]